MYQDVVCICYCTGCLEEDFYCTGCLGEDFYCTGCLEEDFNAHELSCSI
jgi:hypothetical protein